MTDPEIYRALHVLDKSRATLNEWEATFMDSMLKREPAPLTPKQRAKCLEIIDAHDTWEPTEGQDVEVRMPPSIARHFRRRES